MTFDEAFRKLLGVEGAGYVVGFALVCPLTI